MLIRFGIKREKVIVFLMNPLMARTRSLIHTGLIWDNCLSVYQLFNLYRVAIHNIEAEQRQKIYN